MTMNRHRDIEVLSSSTLFRGRVFELVEESVRLPSGLRQDLAIVDHPGAVAVAAVQEDGRMIAVRQYRHAVGDWMTEIPAGRLEPGEDPLRAARRELEEETGLRAREWSLLTRFVPAPGFCSEVIHLFRAAQLEPAGPDRLAADDDEELELVRLRPAQLLEGAPLDAKTAMAAWLVLGEAGSGEPARP